MAYDDFDDDLRRDGKDPRLQLALDRFKLASDADTEQRKAELEDLEFIDEDKQWPPGVLQDRAGGVIPGTNIAVAPQPCLVINKLRQPVQQVTNQQRNAKLQLQFSPKGNGANRDTAEVYEDIARAVQVDSRAHIARNWAFDRAAKCGRGAYRIVTEYANDGDFDLDIVYKRILNQASVYFDPFAQEPDWSDGEWCFIVSDMPVRRFKREFPDSELSKAGEDDLRGIGDDFPDWIGDGGGSVGKTIRVAEYYCIEYSRRVIEGPADDTGQPRTREVDARTLLWGKLTCVEWLETPREQDGRYIPVIPVIWEESNVNGRRSWKGLVRPAKDAQRSYNVMRSKQVQAIGLTPLAPFIMAEGQNEGYEKMWEQANTRPFPALIYRPVTLLGQPVGPPQRDIAEPAIQAVTLAAHEADGDIKATTGIFDPSLGNLSPNDRSGKAILALQKQAEMGSSGGLDNLASMSMNYDGKILRDLIPKVYDRPGRVVAVIGADDERKSIMVNQPFVSQNGEPQPVPPGTPGAKHYDLTKGEYSVAVSVGKSFTTKREEATAMMGELAQAMPQTLPAWADLWVKNMDGPGFLQIADRLKKGVPPQFLDDGDQSPEIKLMQAQQQLQQAGQMMEMLSKELEAKTKIIETDTVKSQAELERVKVENDAKIKIAEIQSQTQFGVAEIKAMLEDYKLRIGHIETIVGHQRDAEALQQQQAHEAAMAGAQMGQESAESQMGREHEAGMQQEQLSQEQLLAQQQAEQAAAQQETEQ